jgi:hypothetical protein
MYRDMSQTNDIKLYEIEVCKGHYDLYVIMMHAHLNGRGGLKAY